WPDPEPCEGNCSFVHDPSLIRRPDGMWVRFSTLGNIAIATAPKLTGPWTYEGPMLPKGTSIMAVEGQQMWAPDVHLLGDTYYTYYAVSRSGVQTSDIGVATSKTCDINSWTDHGSIGVPKSSSYNLIDPNMYCECPTCDSHFTFGSGWEGIFETGLDKDFLSWKDEAPLQTIYNSTIPLGQDFPAIAEGAFLFGWKSYGVTFYYLFFSSGACCNAANALLTPGNEYKIMVCRARAPIGPFYDANGRNCLTQNGGTLVLSSHGTRVYAPGGQGVVFDPDANRVAMYYHYADPNIGYAYEDFFFGFNYIDFSHGWPVV
ncbi:glycoside hydrolase family 43 protein, partial [Lojkania enalia]